jgi:hypothetical protein
MMKRLRFAGLFLALLSCTTLVGSAQAGAAKPQLGSVKQTAKPIDTVAMDGSRVAYATSGRIRVWNVVSGATSVVRGRYGASNSEYATVSEIAIAGRRVAWIKSVGFGNTELDHWLYTARLGGSAHLLRRTLGYNNTDCGLGGPQIAGLVGSGSFLAVSTWNYNDNGSASWNKRLNLVTPARLQAIATGPDAVVSASANAGHIAVVPLGPVSMDPGYCVSIPSTSVGVYIYSAHGALLNTVAVSTPSEFLLGVAISGNRLVALLGEQPDSGPATVTLAVYDWTTGALVHTWPVAIRQYLGEVNLEVSGHLAAVEGPNRLHLVDLTTGKDILMAPAGPRAIGPRGLVYAVNPSKEGRPAKLVFVPMAKLLALVSR